MTIEKAMSQIFANSRRAFDRSLKEYCFIQMLKTGNNILNEPVHVRDEMDL
jgi:hypothetical protein